MLLVLKHWGKQTKQDLHMVCPDECSGSGMLQEGSQCWGQNNLKSLHFKLQIIYTPVRLACLVAKVGLFEILNAVKCQDVQLDQCMPLTLRQAHLPKHTGKN